MITDLDASFVLVDGHGKDASTPVTPGLGSRVLDYSKPVTHPSLSPSYKAGQANSYAHNWTGGVGGHIRLQGRHFVDAYGRVCNLRGVNLSGSCKTPINHSNDTFPSDHRTVTFVGRPFPLEEANEHFSRLRRWGFTFFTWEAIEHEGPGIYDRKYLNYIRELLSMLPRYGMVAFVSLHQDVWSRYSGGSGAPAWTLEAVGFDLNALEETGAAWLGGVKGGGHVEAERGLWPTGYTKLTAATMATCFWAGNTFAPKLKVKNGNGQDVSIQNFLQTTFLNMFDALVDAVGDLESVIGFEMMNEPHRGYIDLQSLHGYDYKVDLHLSHIPSAFQSFQLGAGHPTLVPTWTRSFPMPTSRTSQTLLNTEGRKSWRTDGPTGGECLWEMHGVWGWDIKKKEAVVLRENYFVKHPLTNKKIDWYTDFYFPFLKQWAARVRERSSPGKIIFVEAIPNEFCPSSWTAEHRLDNMVYAPHWYDLNALFSKAFGDFTVNVQGLSRGMFPLKAFYWGQIGARDNFSLQMRNVVENGYRSLGECPVLIGECGVPMDMNKGEAFVTSDFTWQARMMDAMQTALERSLVGYTLWNYNPYNDDTKGDDWNGENFSWFSRKRGLPPFLLDYEQHSPTLDNGARILDAVVRPYPAKTAGIPLKFEYEMTTNAFVFEWVTPEEPQNATKDADGATFGVSDPPLHHHPVLTSRETEIFLPSFITHGRKVFVRGLSEQDNWLYDEARQTLFVVLKDIKPGQKHRIEVSVNPPPSRPAFELNDFWTDFGGSIYATGILFAAICFFWLSRFWVTIE
ncbi:glycoside hydrolase family 5 protein [Amanita thiersii Skay4041]|uniref:Glycoside hydrolase family 5 protein n=1 Tax=Amanita thiersii Skay4041 TaxID=703135 RepID=A0A2A9NLA0_9AGAR|nr:glycoside hydrolase family 5 protein [Amanita thiersii Skay4041]